MDDAKSTDLSLKNSGNFMRKKSIQRNIYSVELYYEYLLIKISLDLLYLLWDHYNLCLRDKFYY